MITNRPHIIVIAGPNGAGKSTTAPALLRGTLRVKEFVNADVIAQGLSAFQPEAAAFHAGRVMLERLHYLAKERVDFAFETTLASRSFATWIAQLLKTGYDCHVVFLWLPSADFAIERVAERVRLGGHNVLENVVRRRYLAGIRNFFELYQPLAASWRFYDNSAPAGPRLIAAGDAKETSIITDMNTWSRVKEEVKQ